MELDNIYNIAKKAGIDERFLEPYGKYKAKVNLSIMDELKNKKDGKLVLVTAITPTKAGEGKTTMSIALTEGLNKINKSVMLCLREPSLGPVFGIKGGATGGGKVTIEPHDDINLHFNGDMHALTSSINLISAIIDNSIFQGNPLNIDPNRVVWKRALDMNDRALREIEVAHGNKNGVVRKDGFIITVASELMAIFCLATSKEDFRKRLNDIIVAYTYDDKPIFVKDLRISNAVMKLMENAFSPNLVQTQEGNPCLVHGGPFANIAHGCNSLFATKMALKLKDIVVTEAGFGADLGAEKFLDIKCQVGGIVPSMVVMVATLRALKTHGGVKEEDLGKKNVAALQVGIANLKRHLENMKLYHIPCCVAINHFATDDEEEIAILKKWCEKEHYPVSFVDGYLKGSDGCIELATMVSNILEKETSSYQPLYHKEENVYDKIDKICKKIYHASKIEFSLLAHEQIDKYIKMGYGDAYICMAKTPQSLSDDPKILNAPEDFTIHIREVNLASGSRFIIPLTGNILTMPGLPKVPAAVKMEDE
jgi:formate--tetrahydrofolate ligase